MISFFDTHAHLDDAVFEPDFDDVLKRAADAGIARIVTIGTDLESSRKAVELAERHDSVFAVAGWHPSGAREAPDDIRPALRELASHPKVVALGETGLDYYRMPSQSGGSAEEDARYRVKQAEIFRQHLEVAAEKGLNCVIHQRESLEDVLAQFTPFASSLRAVFHCFIGDAAARRRIAALNSLVSFTGIVTFKNAETVRQTVLATPLGEFMLETDAPYLAPVPFRGKRCEPAHVKTTAEFISVLKGCTMQQLSDATCKTAKEFFRGLK